MKRLRSTPRKIQTTFGQLVTAAFEVAAGRGSTARALVSEAISRGNIKFTRFPIAKVS